jgi:hypothetical protein
MKEPEQLSACLAEAKLKSGVPIDPIPVTKENVEEFAGTWKKWLREDSK